jgi:dynein heavy chain
MQDRHWRDLKLATGKQFVKDADFSLQQLLELELHQYVADVEDIVELANKESKIYQQLQKIDGNWYVYSRLITCMLLFARVSFSCFIV